MKTRTRPVLIAVALLAYWVGLCNASAFYDPGAQRWLNRDPINELGGINLYAFAANDSVNEIDINGLAITGAGTLALEPTLLLTAEEAAALRAAQAAARALSKSKPCPSPRNDCDKQWEQAFAKCSKELAKGVPDKKVTGGHEDIAECAKGHVSEDCGGNPTPPPPPKKKRRWYWFD